MLTIMVALCVVLVFSLLLVPAFGYFITYLIVVPFVLVPIIFSIQVMHFGLRQDANPNGTLFFRFFRIYFSPNFMGSYRIIISTLFALLVEMISASIFGLIAYSVASLNPGMNDTIKLLIEYIESGDMEAVNNMLLNDANLKVLAYIAYIPSFGIAFSMFFLSTSYNSLSIYFKIKNPMINPMYANRIYTVGKNAIRRKIMKEYWGLNWPIFVLFFIGFASGVCIAYFNDLNYVYGQVIGIIAGVVAMIFYHPIFLNNLESIYLNHEEHFSQAPQMFAMKMQNVISSQLDDLQKQMRDLQNQQEQAQKDGRVNSNDDNKTIDAEVKDNNADDHHE